MTRFIRMALVVVTLAATCAAAMAQPVRGTIE